VGGISYPIMLPRSCDWSGSAPGLVFESAYPTHIDRDLLMVMFASHWDRFEGASFAEHVAGTLPPLPGSATTLPRILMQTAVNDLGTPEVAGEIAARTMRLPYLASSATRPWGLAAAGPMPSSSFTSFAFPDAPVVGEGPAIGAEACAFAENITVDPHERVRRLSAAQEQISALFTIGSIP
jgi:hypothetical protein